MQTTVPPLAIPLSPSSLTVLDKCPRLFRHVYLEHLLWPQNLYPEELVAAELGKQFHRLVELHQRGLDVTPLLGSAVPPLSDWWQVFLRSHHAQPQAEIWSEAQLWIERQGVRLGGRMDRLVIDPQRQHFTIVDWKTERRRPEAEQLQRSWQVRLYPLMLCLAGSQFNQGQPIHPEQIRLTLWYVQHPQRPYERLYSQQQFNQDLAALDQMIERLHSYAIQHYPRATTLEPCRTCWFMSRCYGLMPEGLDPEILAALEGFVRLGEERDPI